MINKTMIYDRLNMTPKKLDDFCKQHHILELSLFGSILRDDFRADSDIDILVVFNHSANPHLSLRRQRQMCIRDRVWVGTVIKNHQYVNITVSPEVIAQNRAKQG